MFFLNSSTNLSIIVLHISLILAHFFLLRLVFLLFLKKRIKTKK